MPGETGAWMSACKGCQAVGGLWGEVSPEQAIEGAFTPASGRPGGSPCPGPGRELTRTGDPPGCRPPAPGVSGCQWPAPASFVS